MSRRVVRAASFGAFGLAALACLSVAGCGDAPEPQAEITSESSGDETEADETETGVDPTLPMTERPQFGNACEQTPVPTGDYIGKVIPNLVGTDQWGETFNLYEEACDRTVVLLRAGFDCGSCNEHAPTYGEYYELYAEDHGFLVVTMLHDLTRELSVEDLNLWANTHGLTHPVILDNDYALSNLPWPTTDGRPLSKLLGPGAEVLQLQARVEDLPTLFD